MALSGFRPYNFPGSGSLSHVFSAAALNTESLRVYVHRYIEPQSVSLFITAESPEQVRGAPGDRRPANQPVWC